MKSSAAKKAAPATIPLVPLVAQVTTILKGLKAPDDPLAPGAYPLRGDAALRLDCVLTKAEGFQAKPPVQIDKARLVAALCRHAGVATEKVGELVEQATRDAGRAKMPEEQGYLDLATAALDRGTKALSSKLELQEREGACRVSGAVELVRFEAA